ncbi:hypothetical protein [Helicobacter sp. UBA3407]|uniref:hypothetical protein n=1 Tax=Helicobacter TaxID=209 RepID=UPI002635E777|nr:hypothetical protein [Helicobacter sp. UBA3407]
MKPDDYYSMEGYLDKRCRQFLKDKQRDENIQNYLCSFILVYWDYVLLYSEKRKKEVNTLLSEIFDVPRQRIEQYLTALEDFKNEPNCRDECLSIKIK